MKTALNRVGFVGRSVAEVHDVARQQRFNSSTLELKRADAGAAMYAGNRSGFFGHAVAFMKDRFFGLVHLKCFHEGDQKAAALTSLRGQISALNVTKPKLKEKYLRELDFKISHGLSLRASYYNKAIEELFVAIDHDMARAQGNVVLPPGYDDAIEHPREANLAEAPSNPEETPFEIPPYRDIASCRDVEHPNGRPTEEPACDVLPPPDYDGFLAERSDDFVHDTRPSAAPRETPGDFRIGSFPVWTCQLNRRAFLRRSHGLYRSGDAIAEQRV